MEASDDANIYLVVIPREACTDMPGVHRFHLLTLPILYPEVALDVDEPVDDALLKEILSV